jgi:hypothetical protein
MVGQTRKPRSREAETRAAARIWEKGSGVDLRQETSPSQPLQPTGPAFWLSEVFCPSCRPGCGTWSLEDGDTDGVGGFCTSGPCTRPTTPVDLGRKRGARPGKGGIRAHPRGEG